MIQGLRLLPWVADNPLFNCTTCQHGDKKMRTSPQPLIARRRQACGYLPHDPAVKVPWGVPLGVDFVPGEGDPDSPDFRPLCPGYLIALPEVQEAVAIRPHWLKGEAEAYLRATGCGDYSPAFDAQGILDGAVIAKQNHDTEERARKAEKAGQRGG